MNELNISPLRDSTLAVTLTVGRLRELVREEMQASQHEPDGQDRLLTAEEASSVLSVSPDWLYRNARKLPFARKLGPKMLRFSYQGILRWLSTRKLS